MKKYFVNDIFYSLQGEGMRAGVPSIFLRLGKCNQTCRLETHGFDCDTEFESGKRMTVEEIVSRFRDLTTDCQWVILTGGEPGLQVDSFLIHALHSEGYKVAIETNGSIALPDGLDWITVSPKVAEHAIRQRISTEVKYVRNVGQEIPRTVVEAEHYLISPAFNGEAVNAKALAWCIDLVQRNPTWRLSCQQHKFWDVR